MDRNDIHIISRHSNWTEEGIVKVLKEKVYSDAKSWKVFLNLLFISLGVGFTVSGIIFFFAYNWTDLHKFAKMGLMEGIIILTTSAILFSKLNLNVKNILLTGNSILVGVLIAVFGQIYQTGANAYDFFLGWTLFITLWVVISNYPPLWLVFLILVNTTFILYSQQVASDWSEVFVFGSLFLLNFLVLVTIHLLVKIRNGIKVPSWFTSLLGLATIVFSTIGIIIGIFDKHQSWFLVLLPLIILSYGMGLIYSIKAKSAFYLSIIPFSIIIIISALLIKISEDAAMFFIVSLFIIVSITFLIKGLLDIQKKWNNGK
jgi:uncharacterized membrane protein